MPADSDRMTPSPTPAAPVRRRLERFLTPVIIPYLIIALFSITFTASNYGRTEELSILDEYQYYDYLVKVPTQLFVVQGEKVGEEGRRALSCRGLVGIGPEGATCDGPQEPDSAFPIQGYNSADIYPPVYFGITWVLAQPFTWLGMDLLNAGRTAGVFWLFAGLAALFALQRKLGVAAPLALGVTLFVITLGTTFWGTQFITTDAPTYLVVGMVGLTAIRFATGEGRWWELPLVSVLGVLVKVQNIGAVMMAAFGLLFYHFVFRREHTAPPPPRRTLVVVGLALGASALGYVGWTVIRLMSSIGNEGVVDLNPDQLTLGHVMEEITRFATTVGSTNAPTGIWTGSVTVLFGAAGLGAAFVMAFVKGDGFTAGHRSFSLGTLLTLLTLGPALGIMIQVMSGYYVSLVPRYGVLFVVPYAVLIGLVAQRFRAPHWPVLLAGAGAALVSIIT